MNTENNEKKKTSLIPPGLMKKPTLLICLCCLCAGVLLIALSGLGDGKSKAAKDEVNATFSDEALNRYNAQFVADVEAKLTAFISQINGVGNASVLVTLETGVQYVYATEQKSSDDSSFSDGRSESTKTSSESSLIIIDGGSGETPVLLKRIEPTILGVVVVCDGADNSQVRESVTEAVKTLCGVGSNRVSVTKKSQ